jgi:hypothetical protein
LYTDFCIYCLYLSAIKLKQDPVNQSDSEESGVSGTSGMDVDSDEDEVPIEEFDKEKVNLIQSNERAGQYSSSESDEEEDDEEDAKTKPSESDEEEDEEEDAKTKQWGPVTSTIPNPSGQIIEQMFSNKSADSVHLTDKKGKEHVYDLKEPKDVRSLQKLLRSPKSTKGCSWHLRDRGSIPSAAAKNRGSFAPGFKLDSEEEYESDSDDDSSEEDVQVGKSKKRSGGSDLVDSDESEEDQSDSDDESADSDSDDDDVVQAKPKVAQSKKSGKQSKKTAGKGKRMNH